MRLPGGAFAASIDADSEGHEGRFYVWRRDEIVDVLGDEEAAFFARIYDVTPGGNFEGASILNRLADMDPLATPTKTRLAAAARQAPRPPRDARPPRDRRQGPRRLERPDDRRARPRRLQPSAGPTGSTPPTPPIRFILDTMSRDGRLAHSWRDGKSVYPGLATDYAAMIKAALALHAATLDTACHRRRRAPRRRPSPPPLGPDHRRLFPLRRRRRGPDPPAALHRPTRPRRAPIPSWPPTSSASGA